MVTPKAASAPCLEPAVSPSSRVSTVEDPAAPQAPPAAALPAEWGVRLLASSAARLSPAARVDAGEADGGSGIGSNVLNGERRTAVSAAASGATAPDLRPKPERLGRAAGSGVEMGIGFLSADIEALLNRLSLSRSGGGSTASAGSTAPESERQSPIAMPVGKAVAAETASGTRAEPQLESTADARDVADGGGGSELLEAVELKNTCPFQMRTRVNGRGKRVTSFVLEDRGPRAQVSPEACLGAVSTAVESAAAKPL